MWWRIAAEWSVISISLWLVSLWPNILTVWLAALVIGSRQHALAVLGHWALHKLLPAAKLAQLITLLPTGVDPNKLRDIHFTHHKATGKPGLDFEVSVVTKFAARWKQHRKLDLFLDMIGLHADESLMILSRLASWKSLFCYSVFALAIVGVLNVWAAIAWLLASITGLMICHRLRARTEHNHLASPGTTIKTTKPSLLARLIYLPHYTWLHAEHHQYPNAKVWLGKGI